MMTIIGLICTLSVVLLTAWILLGYFIDALDARAMSSGRSFDVWFFCILVSIIWAGIMTQMVPVMFKFFSGGLT